MRRRRRPAGHRRQGVAPAARPPRAPPASPATSAAPHLVQVAGADRGGLAGGAPFASPRPGAPPRRRGWAALGSAASGLAGGCAARRRGWARRARLAARLAPSPRPARCSESPSTITTRSFHHRRPPSCQGRGARPLPPGRRCCGRRSYCVTWLGDPADDTGSVSINDEAGGRLPTAARRPTMNARTVSATARTRGASPRQSWSASGDAPSFLFTA